MTIARVTGQDTVGINVNTLTYPGATTAGHLLLCWTDYFMGSGTANTLTGWTQIANLEYVTNNNAIQLFAKTASGSETAVTITPGSAATPYGMGICEYSGTANPYVADGTTTTSGNSSQASPLTTGSITTTNANDLIITVCGIDFSFTSPTWTTATEFLSAGGSSLAGGFMGQNIVSATQSGYTDAAHWSGGTTGAGTIICAFKAAAAASTNSGFLDFF